MTRELPSIHDLEFLSTFTPQMVRWAKHVCATRRINRPLTLTEAVMYAQDNEEEFAVFIVMDRMKAR
jgi:hypothetical protein